MNTKTINHNILRIRMGDTVYWCIHISDHNTSLVWRLLQHLLITEHTSTCTCTCMYMYNVPTNFILVCGYETYMYVPEHGQLGMRLPSTYTYRALADGYETCCIMEHGQLSMRLTLYLQSMGGRVWVPAHLLSVGSWVWNWPGMRLQYTYTCISTF